MQKQYHWQGTELPFTLQEFGNHILKTLDATQRALTSLVELGPLRCSQQPGAVRAVPAHGRALEQGDL